MHDVINNIQNNVLGHLSASVSRGVAQAIHSASDSSGVDFAYLLQQAKAESSFDPEAKAKTSSATGLFQFIETTWLNMVDSYGDKHGIDASKTKQEILELRNDPKVASQMAAEFANENARYLDRNWGGDVGATELYFAHFLGAGQASSFLNARDDKPLASAAALFPKAAAANENVFYDRSSGRAKTVEEVYAYFDNKFQFDSDDFAGPTQLAEVSIPVEVLSVEDDVNTAEDFALMQLASQTNLLSLNQGETSYQYQRQDVPSTMNGLIYNQLDLILMTQMDLPLWSGSDKNIL